MTSKKKKKKENRQNLIKLMAGLCILLVIAIILVIIVKFNENDYYKIEPRAEMVKDIKIDEKIDFHSVGWLRVQGTKLDMPIVYSPSKSEFFPSESDLKSYVWLLNDDSKFHNHMYIMGHNYLNLSSTPKITSDSFYRFEELMAFVYYDFAKKNKYIQLTIDGKDYLYKIFSVGFVKTYKAIEMSDEKDLPKDEMKDYLDLLQEGNIYNYNVDVNENDDIITLATCTRFFGPDSNYEFFVNGRLLRDDEKINNYSVKKNKNYKKIEKKLKGDGGNEDDDL